jgi:hypothetical protein
MPTVEVTRDEQRKWLNELLTSEDVRTREPGAQRSLEDAIRQSLEVDDVETATAIWLVSACRAAGLEHRAAEVLFAIMAQASADGTTRRVLLAADSMTETFPIRACRKCGCTDAFACPDGCRWIEADLCSRCAAYPYPGCLVCDNPAPATVEDACTEGWADGCCPECAAGIATALDDRPADDRVDEPTHEQYTAVIEAQQVLLDAGASIEERIRAQKELAAQFGVEPMEDSDDPEQFGAGMAQHFVVPEEVNPNPTFEDTAS